MIVVNAKSGVVVGTEKSWKYASQEYSKILFVNRLDEENVNFNEVIDQLENELQ